MRIISKFVDYYDCVRRMGEDRSILYLRNKEEIESPFRGLPYGCHIVGFCGKIYPVYTDHFRLNVRSSNPLPTYEVHCSYSAETLQKDNWGVRRFFESHRTCSRELSERLFAKHPVFVASDRGLVYNECLRNYQFYKVFDPFSAYEAISAFLNNIARPMKPIPKIDDKLLAEAHGFDKWSFRKEPGKKRKRCKN